MNQTIPLCVISCLVSPIVRAQGLPTEMSGFFTGAGGLMTFAESPAFDDTKAYRKHIGYSETPAIAAATSGSPEVPNFAHPSFMGGHEIAIDGISSGGDVAPTDSYGVAAVDTLPDSGAWQAISFSVRTTPGLKAADIFTYALDGSDLPANFVDLVELAEDAVLAGMGPNQDLAGLDGATMAVWAGMLDSIADTDGNYMLLFSLSSASIAAATPAALDYFFGGANPSGAMILGTKWRFDGNEWSWTNPEIAYTPQELQLSDSDEIDGFLYDRGHNRLIYTTMKAPGETDRLWVMILDEPLLPTDPDYPGFPRYEYSDPTGGLVTDKIGEQIGVEWDIDAICGWDPGTSHIDGGPLETTSRLIGEPQDTPGAEPRFHASLQRDGDDVVFELSSFPCPAPRGDVVRITFTCELVGGRKVSATARVARQPGRPNSTTRFAIPNDTIKMYASAAGAAIGCPTYYSHLFELDG